MFFVSISGLLIFILTFAASIFVITNNHKNPVNITWFLYSFFISLWGFGLFLSFSTSNAISALLYARFLNLIALMIPAFFLHFVYALLKKEKNYKFFLGFIYILTFSYLVFCLFYPVFFVKSVSQKLQFTYYPNAGLLYFIFPLYYTIIVIIGIITLFKAYSSSSNQLREQLNFLFWAMAIGLTGGSTTFPLLYNIPIFPFGLLGVIVLVIVVAYAITKHDLMDIKLVISRVGSFVAIIGFLVFILCITLFSDLPLIIKAIIVTVTAILFTLYGDKLREKLQTSAVRKWVTDWYNSDQLISRALQKLVIALNREDVFDVIADEINETIKVEKVLMFLAIRDDETGKILSYGLSDNNSNFTLEDPVTLFALQQKEPLLFKLNDPNVTKEISELKLRRSAVLIPFWIKDELDAFFLVDQKSSEAPYTDKDKLVFGTLSIQGAMAIERIRPYEANIKKLYETERQLAISGKIASLAHLIQEYNHEIRTPLTAIKFYATKLNKYITDHTPESDEVYEALLERSNKIADIVNTTLRIQEAKKRQLVESNLNELINKSLIILPPSGITVSLNLKELPHLFVDIDDLTMVFTNLIKNANEAMPKGGDLTISTTTQRDGNDLFVCAEFKDTGNGIEKVNLERIFEPFFSTKVTEGRGLGLSIVFRIVREHFGHIEVQSEIGKGTTFLLKFKFLETMPTN